MAKEIVDPRAAFLRGPSPTVSRVLTVDYHASEYAKSRGAPSPAKEFIFVGKRRMTEAIEQFPSGRIGRTFTLMDLQMPEMNGIDRADCDSE